MRARCRSCRDQGTGNSEREAREPHAHSDPGERPDPTGETSAEVLHELLHAYLPVGRVTTLEAALTLAEACIPVWPMEEEDVRAARILADRFSDLGARDLLHLACCRRYAAEQIKTFDRGLAAAFARG